MYEKTELNYNNFMNTHLEQVNNPHTGAHPLYYISEKEFTRIKDNALIISNPTIKAISRDNREVKYSLEEIGKNLEIRMGGAGNMSIDLSSMKTNSFYILIRASELKAFDNLELLRYGLNDYPEKNLTPSTDSSYY